MNPREFLQLAESLAKDGLGGPAAYRSSISRSYYAAYLVAQEFLASQVKLAPLGGRDKHSAVRNSFLQSGDLDAKQLGIILDTLHTQRKNADYAMSNQRVEEQAQARVVSAQAEALIKELDGLATSPKLAQIVKGMSAWAALPHSNLGPA